jgi:hypothetical protein
LPFFKTAQIRLLVKSGKSDSRRRGENAPGGRAA